MTYSKPLLLILLMTTIQLIHSCSDSDDDYEHAKHRLRTSLKKRMRMTDRDLRNVDQDAVDAARAVLPMIDSHHKHQPDAMPESIFLLAKEHARLASTELLFTFPGYLAYRSTSKGVLTFAIGPFPDETTLVTVNIYTRDVSETDTATLVASKQVTVYPSLKRSFKAQIDDDVIRGWLSSPSDSVILSIVLRDADSGDVLFQTDEQKLVENAMLEVGAVAHKSRQRRDARKQTPKCSEDTDEEQECCLKSADFTLKARTKMTLPILRTLSPSLELGIGNVISPIKVKLTWCNGQCKQASSFKDLFGSITRKIMDNGKIPGEHCCHATEYEHQEIMYVKENKEVQTETMFDIIATNCSCD